MFVRLRRVTIAVWIAAIAILVVQGSAFPAVTGAVLATILLLPRAPHSWGSTRRLPWALAVAVVAHAAWVLAIGDHWFAAALLAIAGAILYWRGVPWYRHEPGLTVLRTALVALLILAGAIGYLARGGSGSTPGAAYPGAAKTFAATHNTVSPAQGGEHTGVILIPEVRKHVLLAPPLPMMRSEIFSKPDDHPLTIPFYGVYWFFRPPDSRPPPDSITIRGSPEDFRFRSVGRAPLKMEAHQNLGKLINLSCCSAIQVALHNAERATEQMHLQLILANSTASPARGGAPPESLGIQPLDGSEHQVLNFAMRPNSGLQQFDDLTVRIFRGWILAGGDRSARISIERFVLIPRGR